MLLTCTQHGWTAPDGAMFSYSRWSPEKKPVAVMIAVHGLSGAALDYEPLGRQLVMHGIVTVAIELRGQGNDPLIGRRGDLANLEDWFADLREFFRLMRCTYPGLSIFHYGESMGAALLTRFLAQASVEDQPAGLILASPVVALPRPATLLQRSLFRLFLWLTPTFRIDVRKFAKPKKGEPPPYVTRDTAHRAWFETAPHRMDRYTIRFFRCLYELIEGCFAAAPLLKMPVLVIYAAHDIFISPARVEEFFSLISSPQKERSLFPEAYHLLLHDHDSPLALARIEEWLRSRINCGAGKLI